MRGVGGGHSQPNGCTTGPSRLKRGMDQVFSLYQALKRLKKNLNHQSNRGQAVVETALILPVIILLFFGLIEFGRAISSYMIIQNAAREGVRLGITGASDSEIVAKVLDLSSNLEGFDDPDRLMVTIQPDSSERFAGRDLEVTVTYWFRVVVPVISNIIGEKIRLRASLAMQI